MAYEPHLIAPFNNSGLNRYYKPWLIGKEAFPDMSNAYPWRGSVKKREGYRAIQGSPLPTAPVQGLKTWINPSTLNPSLIAFSTTKSYFYDFNTFTFVDITQLSDAATVFSFGNGNDDFFWTSNYAGSMWTTNGLGFVLADFPATAKGIFYLTNAGINSWNIHQPPLDVSGARYLNGCTIILPYKGRLVCLNTIEGTQDGAVNQAFVNRARWCQIGSPYVSTGGGHPTSPPAPFLADDDGWRDDIPGRGGFVDADTSEKIVSAAIIKDTLIVAFQRSTWRLRYTGNEILPFIWERLNTQLGAEATHSAIPFDEHVLFFSRYGWIQSDTNDVSRIDLNIPDDSFSVEAVDNAFVGVSRVQGIRDFYRQFAYWSFESIGEEAVNQIYAYNYIDKSWALFNPTVGIRTFGEFYNTSDFTWSSYSGVEDIWTNYNIGGDDIWSNYGSGQNLGFPFLIGGDVSGNIYQMFEFQQPAVTDNGTPFNFSISTKRFNPYIEQGLKCRLGYVDLYCTTAFGGEITINHYVDDQNSPIFSRKVSLYPRGVLNIASITVGNPTIITTVSPHNLAAIQDVTIADVVGTAGNFLNNETIAATTLTGTSFSVPINTVNETYVQGGVIWYPEINPGDAKYVRIYLGAIAHMHQLELTLSSAQKIDAVKGRSGFEMQGLVLWTRAMGMIRG